MTTKETNDTAAKIAALNDLCCKAMGVAGRHVPSNSPLALQAANTILKHVDALPNVAQRIDAATVAARYAPSGSDLRREAEARLKALKEVDPMPAVPSRGAARTFVSKFTNGS